MSLKARNAVRLSFGRRSLVFATLALASLGATAPAMAQEPEGKTVREHIKEYWDKLVAKMESGSRATGEQYHKLKDEAARASGPAREKLSAEMEVLSKKWAIAREKLATTVELQMNTLGEEVKTLEEKADKASGPTRERMHAEMKKLHEEWTVAREKMEGTLSSNVKSSREEIDHLKEHAAAATESARAKLAPRMERLKAEYQKNREKLSAYLEADLKQTREDMEKLRTATSNAAGAAGEKLSTRYHELKAKLDHLLKDKESDE
jgi:uncharacterized protein YicC (UPF0701 family)